MSTDLSWLPPDLAASARINPNGEVEWPLGDGERVIDALAKTGHVVLGLDLRKHEPDDATFEIAWSSYDLIPDLDRQANVTRSADVAHEALKRSDIPLDLDWVLITWD